MASKNMENGPLGPLVKGLAAGIGLASEYRHHRKEKSAAKKTATSNTATAGNDSQLTSDRASEASESNVRKDSTLPEGEEPHISAEDMDSDERLWNLDEAQDEVYNAVSIPSDKTGHDPTTITKRFTDAHPPIEGFKYANLSLPVVLPQRRPKDRSRGFIRAYAPLLQESGIDQETFLEFIEVFNTATQASPWIDAVNLASLALLALPTGISQAISIAIAIAVDITKNLQSRHRHSYILDQMNNDFFRPRGLYALLLTWNPDSTESKVDFNLNETVFQSLAKPEGLIAKSKHSFRPSMGNTVGTAFAEIAPLVFPVLDSVADSQTSEAKNLKQKFKNAQGFVGNYFDKRAQAEHAGEHPDSQLNVTNPDFKSRYSDPNNPTNSGSLVSLVTGGKFNPPSARGLLDQGMGRGGGRGIGRGSFGMQRGGFGGLQGLPFGRNNSQTSQENQQNVGQTYGQRGMGSPLAGGIGPFGGNNAVAGGIKRVFQHHVLYLAIINMPTDEEMAAATQLLQQTKSQTRQI